MQKTIYIINDFFKSNDGKIFHNYLTDLLDADSQFNNNYNETSIEFNLLQIKIKYEDKFIYKFIYNTKNIHVITDSLIDYLIEKTPLSNFSFDNEFSKNKFISSIKK